MGKGEQPDAGQQLEQQLTPEIYGALWRYCRRLAPRYADAEDLLQDSLARALLAFPRLRDRSALQAWLFAIARRRWLDLRRSRAWREAARAAQAEHSATDDSGQVGQALIEALPDPRHEADASFDLLLQQELQRLPLGMREVIELHYFDGLSLAEVGQVLRISAAAAKQRLYRGREALRTALERQGCGGLRM